MEVIETATGKRFYWLKLKESFMTSDTVDFLMSQKDGANYVVLYQMLCLKTINTEGRFSRIIGEIVIPYDVNKIQRDCKWFSLDTIRVALELYKRFGLVYEEQDGTLVITDHHNLVGYETDYREQKANQRARKLLESNGSKNLNSVEVCVQNDGEVCGQEYGQDCGQVHQSVHTTVHTDNRDKILENRDKDNRDREKEKESLSAVSKTSTVQRKKQEEDIETRFNIFWNAYGHKKSRTVALRAFRRINPDDELLKKMIESIEQYHKSKEWRGGYRMNGATWLNGECWNDEYDDNIPIASNPKQAPRTLNAAKYDYGTEDDYDEYGYPIAKPK